MKNEPVPIAKISRPTLPSVFKRTRLFRLLDELRKHPVLWISGAPGTGKTTLVASYIETRKLPCLWYQVDQGDDDIATFFYYIGLAAKKAASHKGKSLPKLTPEYLSNLQVFSRHYFQELFSRLKAPFVLVFDNYQEVPADSQFHELIRTGLELIPYGSNAILLSRSAPPPALPRLQLNRNMVALGTKELRLTLEESVGIARLGDKWKPHMESVRQLHDYTDGWVAGLVLMIEHGQSGDTEAQPSREMVRETFFNYFAGEIFDKMDSVTKDFLLQTACLPNITEGAAGQLTGLPQADRILSDMNRRHYFTEKKSHDSHIYLYHPLFREFLLWRAEETFGPQQFINIYRKAAGILAASGQIEDTVDLYQKSRDWPSLAGLICRQAPSLLAQGRFRTLKQWLENLPEEMLVSDPWLCYWLGQCHMPFNPIESRNHFTKAFERFKDQHNRSGMLLASCGVVETILTEWGDFKQLDPWTAAIDGMLKESKAYPSADVETRVTFAMFAALMFRQPQHPDMRYWAERAEAFIQNDADVFQRILMGGYLAHYRFWIGDVTGAGLVLDIVRQLAETSELSPLSFAIWKMQEAVHGWHKAEFDTCLRNVSDGLKASEESGVHILDNWLHAQAVYASLSQGDLAQAKVFLDKMRPILKSTRHLDISHYHHLSSYYNLLTGNIELALQHGQIALKLNREVGTPFPEGLVSITMAQVWHERGEEKKASSLISRARHIGLAMKSHVLEMLSDLTIAHFALERGEEKMAIEPLKNALRLAKIHDVVNFAGWRSSMVARLCIKALEAGIEVEYVQNLIRKRNLMPDAPPLLIEDWPWPLKVFTLGRFSLVIDGKPLRFTGKAQHKPLELLKALIVFGGREVSQDQLTDVLWPEADGDKAHFTLDTTLHRLRKLLGHEKAIQFQDQRLTLDARYCWVDAWAFERLLGEIDTALTQGNINNNEISSLTEKALQLYEGAFIRDDLDTQYILSCRERLRSKFLRKLGLLGQFWEQSEIWDKAVDVYLRALEVEELSEVFYQRLMICYQKQGRRVEALYIYDRCRKALSTNMGIKPSPETETIYEALRAEG